MLRADQHDSEESDDDLSDIEPLNDTTHTDMSHIGGDNMGFLESLIQEMGNEGDTAGTTWEPYNIFGEDNDDNSDEMHIMDEPANNTNNKRWGWCICFTNLIYTSFNTLQRTSSSIIA